MVQILVRFHFDVYMGMNFDSGPLVDIIFSVGISVHQPLLGFQPCKVSSPSPCPVDQTKPTAAAVVICELLPRSDHVSPIRLISRELLSNSNTGTGLEGQSWMCCTIWRNSSPWTLQDLKCFQRAQNRGRLARKRTGGRSNGCGSKTGTIHGTLVIGTKE